MCTACCSIDGASWCCQSASSQCSCVGRHVLLQLLWGGAASEPGALNPVTVHSRCLGKGSYRPWIANSAGDLPVRHINFRILLCRARIRIHCGRELHNPGALPCLSGMGYSFILRTTELTTPQYRTLCARYWCLLDFVVTCQPERSGKGFEENAGLDSSLHCLTPASFAL